MRSMRGGFISRSRGCQLKEVPWAPFQKTVMLSSRFAAGLTAMIKLPVSVLHVP
jgi:hypothetical protein